MTHTPGPWSCTFASSHGDYVVHSDDHYILAFCPTAHPKANATLMAASPTMYSYIKIKANSGDDEAMEIISQIDA